MLISKINAGAQTVHSSSTSWPYSRATSKRKISFEDLYKKLQENGFKNVSKKFNKVSSDVQKVYVDWGTAVVAESSVALGTDGIATCAVLKLIDPTSDDIHYMLHAYSDTEPDLIAQSLKKARSLGLSLKDSEIEIMPGGYLDSESTPHILEALYKVNHSLIDKISLIRDFKVQDASFQGLVVYDGKTYRYPETYTDYSSSDYSTYLDKDGYEEVLLT